MFEDLQSLKSLQISSEQVQQLHVSLCSNLKARLGDAFAWRWQWEIENPYACYELVTDSMSSISIDVVERTALFPTIIYYKDLNAANEITLYNCLLLLLYKLGEVLPGFKALLAYTASDNPGISRTNPIMLPEEAATSRALAVEICRSVEFHLLDIHASSGSFFLLLPLRVAAQAFEADSRERKWISWVCAKIADINAFEISRNLTKARPTAGEGQAEHAS